MTATLISLFGITAFAVVLTWWVYAPRQRERWDEASQVLFEETSE